MAETIHRVQELAHALGFTNAFEMVQALYENEKAIRECGVELILYYSHNITFSSRNNCAQQHLPNDKHPSLSWSVPIREYTWYAPGNPDSFIFKSINADGEEVYTEQFIFGFSNCNKEEIEKALDTLDDTVYLSNKETTK